MAAVDISEVKKFLAETPPFSTLDEQQKGHLTQGIEVIYVRQGQSLELIDETATLHLIRRGAFEISTSSGILVDQIADGECFGVSSVLAQNPDGLKVRAMEDSLVYRIAKTSFLNIAKQNEAFALFFEHTRHFRSRKLSQTQRTAFSAPALQLSTPIEHIMTRQLVYAFPDETIRLAAQRMTKARVSSILITENNRLIGIVTDRDLRSRVLAMGGSAENCILNIMTSSPSAISKDALVMQAQTLMSEHNIHHLPVVDEDGIPVGVVTAADLLRHQELSPIFLINQIHRQNSIEALVSVCKQWPTLIVNLIRTDMKPADIGQVLAAISDNLTRRLIVLAIEQFGAPPMAFLFLVFGSQARYDQSLGSDQDNGLMLSRTPTEEEGKYFAALAEFVCNGLNQCGSPLCPGGIMASNRAWRLTVEEWQKTFVHWIHSAAPGDLLHANIFFDIRCIYGDKEVLNTLIATMQQEIRDTSLFLATLARSAVSSKPPLGFFRHFLLESSGEHKHQLDLKHQGLALINDIARLYGLACKQYRVGTLERIEQAIQEKLISVDVARNLMDAWNELSALRLDTQRKHWQSGNNVSAYLDPSSLSPLERKHLKVTFSIISQVQEMVLQRFAGGYS